MSIDQRLRNGLHPADPDHGLDTLAALRRVEQRATQRARTTRMAVGALRRAALVAVIGVGVALQRGDRTDGRGGDPDVRAGAHRHLCRGRAGLADLAPRRPGRSVGHLARGRRCARAAAAAVVHRGDDRRRLAGRGRPPPHRRSGGARVPGRQRVRRHLPVVAHRRPAGVRASSTTRAPCVGRCSPAPTGSACPDRQRGHHAGSSSERDATPRSARLTPSRTAFLVARARAARSPSRRRRGGRPGGRGAGWVVPARTRRPRGPRGSRPTSAGPGPRRRTSSSPKRSPAAAYASASSSREATGRDWAEAHAPSRAPRGRERK